jgi:hypothetical protein
MTRIPSLVLGSGVTALGALRASGRAGVSVYAADPVPGFERMSRWCRVPEDKGWFLAPLEAEGVPRPRTFLLDGPDDLRRSAA